MRSALAAALVVAVAQSAVAQEVGVTIIEHGIYTAETVRTERLPNGFNSNIVQNICHVATTEAIPAKPGVQFGFRFRVDGAPANAVVDLTRVTRFPTALKPPTAPEAQSVSQYSLPIRIGTVSYIGYGFDHSWELVSGPWVLELWQGKKILAQQRFEIGEGELPTNRRHSNENCFELSASLPGIIRTGGTP